MCSRLSTAGSIAAPIDAPSAVRKSWCSRLSTAGSIAAAPTTPAVSCGAGVLPPINGGLHCGDPRHARWSPAWPRVLPPINGGLHCGLHRDPTSHRRHLRAPAYQRRAPLRPYPGSVAAPQVSPCSRLSTAGSIAAMLPPRRPCSRSCAPAYQRRAPLRRDYCPIYVLGKKGVLPPINGGLHCGVPACGSELPGVIVLPPINGGLHCGSFESATLAIYTPGAPAYQRRAPLRPLS